MTSFLRRLPAFALLFLALAAQAQGESDQNPKRNRPNYRRQGTAWQTQTPPDSTKIRYRVFLIGDVGKPASQSRGGEPSLNYLHQQILKAGANSTTVYLGDNIYEYGMPEEGAYDRKASEERMRDQLDVFRGYRGEKYMIPGNHDWKQGLPGAYEQLMREQRFVENYLARDSAAFGYSPDFFTPGNGCPGPFEVRLQDDLVLITLNSQWFLMPSGERPFGSNSGCGVEDEAEVFSQLEDVLSRNRDKNIMVVAHHPLFSDGVHGGYFTVADHIFPLSIVFKYAFIPLPVLGSIYPLARKYGGISQDVPHPLYQAYRKGLIDIFNKYPNVVYAAGHEHNLQYFKEGSTHYIVSGSGCKTQHVKPGRRGGAIFSDKEKGWAQVNYYTDGQVWAEYFIPQGKGETARRVFRTALYTKPVGRAPRAKAAADTATAVALTSTNGQATGTRLPQTENAIAKDRQAKRDQKKKDAEVLAQMPLPSRRPNFKDSTVTVAANPSYARHGKFHNWLLGEHYRQEWAAKIPFKVIDLQNDKDGLTPYKTGGGKQTASLKLRNDEGYLFTLRGIDKDPAAVLPENLRTGLARAVLQDQISAQHPYASFVLPPLAEAAGILHTNPVPVFIPQDPLLGQYYTRFANLPAALEEDAKDSQDNVASLGYAKKLVSTDKMIEHLIEDNDDKVNEKAFARSRLFDMWIGDWDRHEDQWRWAERKNKDGDRSYTAVPEDRDIAFFRGDGVLPYLVSRKFAVRNFQSFGYDYADFRGLNQTGMSNDRVFMSGVTKADWVAQAEAMKAQLTDAVIDKAFREKWDPKIFALHGPEIVAKLKSRRDLLPKLAADYADVLAETVEVRGSEKNEQFTVLRQPDNTTRVTMQKINKEGKVTKKILYDRTFDNRVTDEVRLYGIAGQDRYSVSGEVKNGLKLRVIAGTGRDSITTTDRVGGLFHKTHIYDADTGNVVRTGPEARLRLEPGIEVSRYDHPKRFDLKDYRLDYTGPAFFFGYNIDDGILLGGGITRRHYGFRREPYAWEQSLTANLAPARGAYNIRYLGQFTRILPKTDLRVFAQFYGPQLLFNFFGIGNNTANLATETENDKRVTNRTVSSSYRVRFNRLTIAPTLERKLFSFMRFGIGPQFDQFRVENDPIGAVIADSIGAATGTFENRRFGVRATDFQANQYLGGITYLNLDAVSSAKNPRIGIRWHNEFQYNWQLNGEGLNYGRISSEIRAYLTPNFPFQLTYAGRLGIQHNYGDYRFYQANTLGGTTNLRGYRRTRYAGRTAVYGNLETRLQLFSFNAYIFPGKFGLLGLADVGRVYSDNDTGAYTGLAAFHTGFGGGVYVDILKQAIINVTYAVGEEKLVLVGFDFLF